MSPSACESASRDEIGWDHPATVNYFEAFCKRYDRYRLANEVLVENARISSDHCVLDLAAGTGRTAEVALRRLGTKGRIHCVEPAQAMRLTGLNRCRDARITWASDWPSPAIRFDRILCGAAVWQLHPFDDPLVRLAKLLASGGAIVFNIPSGYLGQPDQPGGGRDPLLLELPALLASTRALLSDSSSVKEDPPPDADGIEKLLAANGLRPERWEFSHRLTQEEYRDWLKLPVLTNRLLQGLDPQERALRIDQVFALTDVDSWRWERWLGWTAWAPS